MILRATLLLVVTALAVGAAARGESNWPRWRGPEQNGHTSETNLPVEWSASNIVWKKQLPGSGQSSPIIWGERIFLTAEQGKGAERLVFCVSRKNGEILWQQTAWKGTPEKSHDLNGWASATCATDGEIVVAFFGLGGLHAYTVEGKPLWSKNLGTFEGPWGTAACPVIVDNLVIQNCDADKDALLIAFDKKTGKEVWHTKRKDYRGWSTPIVINTGKRRELVLNGHEGVQAYDPASGKELWFCSSKVGRGEPTITPAGDLLCVVNGLTGGEFYAIRPGGDGNVSDTHRAWSTPRKGARDIPSPIVVGQYIIVPDMSGVTTCYDAKDGHIYWNQRLTGKYSGSPIAANGLVYVMNEAGVTMVVKPGPKLDLIAQNPLPAASSEIFRATPTPSDGQIFIRSTTMLYCIGK